MAEEHWQTARLIPTSGINSQDETERRATSAGSPDFGLG
jgi:hypothetical protein